MATLTGRNGGLRFAGVRVAKVREFSLNMSRDALEDTAVGDDARTYVPGLFGANGQATLLIDPQDTGGLAMINSIKSEQQNYLVEMTLNAATGAVFEVTSLVTSAALGVRVGDVQSASMTFQVTGPVGGTV